MNRREYQREYIAKYRIKNGDKIRQIERERYHAQTPEQKAEKIVKNRERRQRLRIAAIEHYGGKCSCCGETEPLFLCIDHINGGGNQHRKTLTTNSIGEWLFTHDYPKDFQVLCHNCNMAKGIYGQCPHKTI